MVSSAKHRREKGKCKSEKRNEKYETRKALRRKKKHFNAEDTEFAEGAEKKEVSDEKIKHEEQETKEEKNRRAVDAAAGKAGHGTNESHRDGFEARLFAEGVERAGRGVARKVAPEKGKPIMEPHEELNTAPPHKRAAHP